MRVVKLKIDEQDPRHPDQLRGFVMGPDPERDGAELEIAYGREASPQLLAMCALHDEIAHWLNVCGSVDPVAKLLHQIYTDKVYELQEAISNGGSDHDDE